MLLLIEANSDSGSDESDGVNIAVAVLLAIAVIGLVISIVINIFLVVRHKQSRCVVTSTYIHSESMQLQLIICCRYDVDHDQSNVRYSDVKQSVSKDYTIKESTNIKSSGPEYEAIEFDQKTTDCNVKMDANPAYQATNQ